MNCHSWKRWLIELDVLIPERPRAWLTEAILRPHAVECEGCRVRLRRLENLSGLVHGALTGTPFVPLPRVMRRRAPVGRLSGWALAAAGGVLAVSAPVLLRHQKAVQAPYRKGKTLAGVPKDTSPRSVLPARPRASSSSPPRLVDGVSPRPTPLTPGRGVVPKAVYRASHPAPTVEPIRPDLAYLNGATPELTAFWGTGNPRDEAVRRWLARKLPAFRDDFVRVPLPRLASLDPKGPGGEAIRQYEQEAKVVDQRLFRKVTLQLKGVSLEELCAEIRKHTGVRILAARGIRDEKVTVFVKERPARDVMRQVVRLFSFYWSRSGEPGAYQYELVQNLRSRLAEEEMRSRDLHEAMVAIDTQMAAEAPVANLSLAQLRQRAKQASGAEKERLNGLLRGGWGVLKVYNRMSPAERAALLNGEHFSFSTEHPDLNRRLPAEWKKELLEAGRQPALNPDTGQFEAAADRPDAVPFVDIWINRDELGQLTLEGDTRAHSPSYNMNFGSRRVVATGKSPSVGSPRNAEANKSLRMRAPFSQRVSLRPEPSCPRVKEWYPHGTTWGSTYQPEMESRGPRDLHLTSADVWEEIHRKTGLPVVADYFLQVYPQAEVTVPQGSTFDALARIGDRLSVRWKLDGDFLMARSTGYFWTKLKEVPNRLLRQWQARQEAGTLGLEDISEMASLTDQQLNSTVVDAAIQHCWGLYEWSLVGPRAGEHGRKLARFLGLLSPAQREQVQKQEGLPLGALTEELREEAKRARIPTYVPNARLKIDFVPAGRFIWMPHVAQAEAMPLTRVPVISGPTVEAVLTQARQHLQTTVPSHVRRSLGVLSATVYNSEGEAWRHGRPPVLSPVPGQE